MADTATVPSPVAEEAPPKGRKKMRLIAVLLIVVLAGAAGVKMTVLSPAEAAVEDPEPEEGGIVTIGEMTTSLAGGGSHYVRVELAAVLNAAADPVAAEERFPLMRDRALGVLMAFTPEDLRTVEGAERLRTALTQEAQTVWEEDQVLRIVLTDLLVQ